MIPESDFGVDNDDSLLKESGIGNIFWFRFYLVRPVQTLVRLCDLEQAAWAVGVVISDGCQVQREQLARKDGCNGRQPFRHAYRQAEGDVSQQ